MQLKNDYVEGTKGPYFRKAENARFLTQRFYTSARLRAGPLCI